MILFGSLLVAFSSEEPVGLPDPIDKTSLLVSFSENVVTCPLVSSLLEVNDENDPKSGKLENPSVKNLLSKALLKSRKSKLLFDCSSDDWRTVLFATPADTYSVNEYRNYFKTYNVCRKKINTFIVPIVNMLKKATI